MRTRFAAFFGGLLEDVLWILGIILILIAAWKVTHVVWGLINDVVSAVLSVGVIIFASIFLIYAITKMPWKEKEKKPVRTEGN